MFDYDSRYLLVYFAVKYQGDFQKIYSALVLKEEVPYEEAKKVYDSLKCKVMTLLDYDYPEKLKTVCQPPMVLFYYGDISLLDKESLAVVGSREYSNYGKHCTERIIKDVIPGRVLISGLAKGIDAIAHETAIKCGAKTIAVLGSGIDYCYPSDNKELYEEIKKNHLLISEYPGKTPPNAHQFPMRNRIVVGLSDGIFVPQINSFMSGTMISYCLAVESNKAVIVAPHPIGSPCINNELINEGAAVAINAKQIKYELKWR